MASLRKALLATTTIALLALSATPAMAAYSHADKELGFSPGAGCLKVQDIAIAEPEGWVYVSCRVGIYPNEVDQIRRFNLDGSPASFSAKGAHISGNVLTNDPGSANGRFLYEPQIAVDNSNSSNHGKLFVSSSPNVDFFLPTGAYGGAIVQPLESTIPNNINGVEVGPTGSVYVSSYNPGGRVSRYDTDLIERERLYTNSDGAFQAIESIRVDSTGAIWGKYPEPTKYEKDQFTTELSFKLGTPPAAIEPFVADRSPFEPKPLDTSTENPFWGGFDVDLSDNDLYLTRGDRVETYSQGTAAEPVHQNAPAFGVGELNEASAVAVTADHHVYVATIDGGAAKVFRYGPGDILPDVHTLAANIDDVGHDGATVHGRVELAGGGSIVDCHVEWGTDTQYLDGSAQCSPDAVGSNYAADQDVSAEITGLTPGTAYHYRFVAENANGENFGIDRVVTPAYVLKVQTLPASEIEPDGARLNASFDPDGIATDYRFEYGVDTDYGLETDLVTGVTGSGVQTVGTVVDGLPSGKTFHYRVVATNANGTTTGPDRTFRTASPPDVFGVRATEVSADGAQLNATVDPTGVPTTYRFEYGTTPGYGTEIPVPDGELSSTTEPVEVSEAISGLAGGVTYHFRIVATNQFGSTTSPDTTFDFTPPSCPNNQVRQETGASYLPDCRAYELVSPGAAGAAVLMPGRVIANSKSNEPAYGGLAQFVTNRGFARAPSRFTFFAAVSAIEGLDPPIGTLDMYMTTRTNSGWVSSTPGLQGSNAFQTGRKECSETMSLCIDHQETESANLTQENAPYMFTADGREIGQLPTNVHTIERGNEFVGNQRMSGDFSHFVFASNDSEVFGGFRPGIAFTPDGLTGGLGSAYDNDLGARTVRKISVLGNGDDLPLIAPRNLDEEGIDFPGLSADGSRILMSTPGTTAAVKRLYLRVDDLITFDISQGKDVSPIGMTRDGERVLFTTDAQIAAGDEDSSADLYLWEDDGSVNGSYRVVSQNAAGDSDDCSVGWISGCGVAPLNPTYAHPDNNRASAPGMDDLFAESSGDVYFYSPELLDPDRPGIRNQRNLYVFRGGAPRLVATLDPGTEVTRMQISPDGAHAALLTNSRLLSYDNQGFDEVYTYDPGSGALHCASCDPTGTPPSDDALASEAGRFMSNDGRTFFSTPDSLVARDKNGRIIDTYEYVDGRPQLISSGLGARDFTGGSDVLNFGFPSEHIGLEHVSRDGTDVFFSTFETLVSRDFNGEFVKFYDARVGGGFSEPPEPAPCAAADECHGPDSQEPAYPEINSGGQIGEGGVPKAKKPKKHKKNKKKHKKNKKKSKKAKKKKSKKQAKRKGRR